MHVLTLIAAKASIVPVAETVNLLEQQGVKIANGTWLSKGEAYEFHLPMPLAPNVLHALQHEAEDHWRVDIVHQPLEGREKQLLISDMDSTMIHQECIDELADMLGIKAYVAEITDRAMRGELPFEPALRERVALLKGMEEAALQRCFESRITLMEGARTLLATMKKRGAYCLLVSGGFTFFTQRVAEALGFDAQEANRLQLEAGVLTGTVAEPILGKEAKREALLRACAARGISPQQTIAVGDGANDLPMLLAAGTGVAYRAKPLVREQAKVSITHANLAALLYVQGIPRSEWVV